MIYHLEINLVKHRLPPPDVTVIVEGGIALWNGKDWLSRTVCGGGRVIQWEVKWWAHLPILSSADMAFWGSLPANPLEL